MDRCAAAYAYHKQGYNCAQSVAGAFADLTGTAPEQLMAAMGGFGGGVGGSHEELWCASTPRPRSSAAGSRRCLA